MRGQEIKKNLIHDAGAIAKCSYCGRYTDDRRVFTDGKQPQCDCGKSAGWCGSFKPPTEESKWSNHNKIINDERMFEIMDGMEEVNRKMVEELEAKAPTCHFRKMGYEVADALGGGETGWWECSVCGHTKPV